MDELKDEILPPESVPPWDPKIHSFRGDILLYQPGYRLIYELRFDPTVVIWRFLAALLLGWLLGLLLKQVSWSVIACVSVVGFLELVWWKTGRYDSTRWEWNWYERTLTETMGDEEFSYDFSEMTEILVKTVRREHRWSSYLSGSGKQHRFYSFCTQILVAGPDQEPFVVASTQELQLHPHEVQLMGLCFAAMLAQNIQIPLRILDPPDILT